MTTFAATLKSWRKRRRYSQLDLALEAEVSARHLSFLETGRARPSPEMVQRLGEALQVPLDARNQLLVSAGYAARYAGRAWDSAEMAPVRAAVTHTLDAHAPFPGIALNRLWQVVRMNDPAQRLFAMMGVQEGESLLDLLMSEHLPAVIENWPEVAHHTAQRLHTESAAQGGVEALETVADYLSRQGDGLAPSVQPFVPTIYSVPGLRLSLFATVAQFGTPTDLALDDLKIELFFPADAETDALLRGLAQGV